MAACTHARQGGRSGEASRREADFVSRVRGIFFLAAAPMSRASADLPAHASLPAIARLSFLFLEVGLFNSQM